MITILVFFVYNVKATVQIPDSFCYNGKCYMSGGYSLMRIYFDKNQDKNPFGKTDAITLYSTGITRGHIATYEIRDSGLYLKDVIVEIGVRLNMTKDDYLVVDSSMIDYVLGASDELKIDWFSGLVILPTGNVLNNTPFDDYPENRLYSSYTLFLIKQGSVLKKVELNYEEFSRRVKAHYNVYTQSQEYIESYEHELRELFFQTLDFKYSLGLWNKAVGWENNAFDDSYRRRAEYNRRYDFAKTENYKKVFENWKRDTRVTKQAEIETYKMFQLSDVRPVILSPEIVSCYIEL